MFRLWFGWSLVFELVHFIERLSVHLYVGRLSWLDAVDDNFALVRADFHAVFCRQQTGNSNRSTASSRTSRSDSRPDAVQTEGIEAQGRGGEI